MLKFSKHQMLDFERANWRNFIQDIAHRLGSRVPQLVEQIGERDLVHAVHQNANAAYGQFGMREDADIEAYVDHAARLGSGFPADIAVYWAGDILADDGFMLMSERMSYLDSNVTEHVATAFGPDTPWVPVQAYKRYAQFLAVPRREPSPERSAIPLLEAIWPERANLCEYRQLHDFCAGSQSLAEAYGIDEPRLRNRLVLMTFLFGARFDFDGFYPWAAPILQNDEASAQTKMEQLEATALTEVISVWAS